MPRHNETISQIFGVREREGEIGLEFEYEGANLPTLNSNNWTTHNDGSLRAIDGHQPKEYVLGNPVARAGLNKVLEALKKHLTSSDDIKVQLSNRCSVHVHLNASDWQIRDVYTWLCCYYILEEILADYCGKDRKGNLFCLPATDAEYVIDALVKSAIEGKGYRELMDGNLHYAGCNTNALTRHGSLEFRMHGGVEDPTRVEPWVRALLAIKDFSSKFRDPREVVTAFSSMGARQFVREALGDYWATFYYVDNVENKLWNGMRLAQDIAFAVDWEAKTEKADNSGTPPAPAVGFDPFIPLRPRQDAGNPFVNELREWNIAVDGLRLRRQENN